MSYFGTTDPMLEIAKGNVTGHTGVNKFGNNGALATSSTETIWDGSSVYAFPATALITSVSQTADQSDMRSQLIEIQGLDASWALITQTFALDATLTTTPIVFTATTDAVLATTGVAMIRVFRMKVLAAFVTTSPIRAHNVGETVDYAIIQTGYNQTLMAIYTVPFGKTAYINNYWGSLNKDSGGGDPDVVVRMWHQDNANTYAPQLKHLLGLDSDASSHFTHAFAPQMSVGAQTDIYLTAENLSGTATADVSGGFDLVLVDD